MPSIVTTSAQRSAIHPRVGVRRDSVAVVSAWTVGCALLALAGCTALKAPNDVGADAGPPSVDECALRVDDCEPDLATCVDTPGGYTCQCSDGYGGDGHGVGGCIFEDPSLVNLTVGLGATLFPTFSPTTTMYTVTLPRGATSTTLTPTAAQPARSTITVEGSDVPSGASAVVAADIAPRIVDVVVLTITGATRRYSVAVRRASAVYVKPSNTEAADVFGMSVSLSADGTRLAVGARYEDSSATGVGGDEMNDSASASGAVYVFARTGSIWAQEAYIKASNTGADDEFGTSVSLSADGSRLAVGAPNEDSSAVGVDGDGTNDGASNSGAVYVFSRTTTTWAQEAYVKPSNTETNDLFGASVSLSGDGTRLAVGAFGEDSASAGVNGDETSNVRDNAGAVYVFSRMTSVWAQEAYIKASNPGDSDFFGTSVSLAADGIRLAVGARGEASGGTGINGDQTDDSALRSGAAYVFVRSGTGWTQEAYVKASNTGADDAFGGSVSLSADATRLAVRAEAEDSSATSVNGDQTNDAAPQSGAVYVFSRDGATWVQEAYVKASNTDASDFFGISAVLSPDGTRLAVGAYDEDSNAVGINGNQSDDSATDSGATYVFSRTGTTWTQAAYVKATNTGADDVFGYAVSLSVDGLAVSAYREDSSATGIDGDQVNNDATDSAAVYIY